MNGTTGTKGGSLFGSEQTPFDYFCEGMSYGEIVEETGLDLFTVMSEIAKESTVHAAFRSINPYVEQEYQIAQLHKVIKRAWESVDSIDSEGKELAVIVQAVRGISQVLHKGPAAVPGTDEKPKLPEGLTDDIIAAMGAMQVRAKFGQTQGASLIGLDGGLKKAEMEH